MPSPVFVCGATGTQGGVLTRHLLRHAVPVHALVRDTSSPKAKTLGEQGVALFQGDFDNEPVLRAAIAGCSTVFLNLSPDFLDKSAELRRAESIIAIAKAAGVNHFIYASGLAVNAPEKLHGWDPNGPVATVLHSKQNIEAAVRAAGFPCWTVLRPGNFMANYLTPLVRMYAGLVETGVWRTALARTSLLPMVDTDTIGAFACAAVLDPKRFHEQDPEIVDEMVHLDDILQKLSTMTGRELKAEYMPDEEIDEQKATNPIIAAMFVMRNLSEFVDLDRVRSWGIPQSSVDAFLLREKEAVKQTYSSA